MIRALVAGAAFALAPPSPADGAFSTGIHRQYVERVSSAESDEYHAILEEFGRHLESWPDDFVAIVERCRFVTNYSYQEDVTIASAYEDSENCIAELSEGAFATMPEVRLFLLEQKWGQEGIQEAERLLSESRNWGKSQRAALHARLSELYSGADADKSGRHATVATDLDPSTAAQIAAAGFQIRMGARQKAIELLRTMPREEWNEWTLAQAVGLLVDARDAKAAYALVRDLGNVDLESTVRYSLVRALLSSGETIAGNALLEESGGVAGADDAAYPNIGARRALFEIRRDYGSADEALAAYQKLRDAGWKADPFGWFRLSLLGVSVSAPWTWRDLTGVAVLLAMLATLALLPLLIIAPIHYRSAVKRLKGFVVKEPTPASPWTLSQVWYATASIIVLAALSTYVFSYAEFESLFAPAIGGATFAAPSNDNLALGRALLYSGILGLVAVIPLFRQTTLRGLLAPEWSITRALLIGFGLGLVFVFVASILKTLTMGSGFAIGVGTTTVRGMQGIRESYGSLALVGFACVLTPILEEFVFRGVILRACARHIALWGAIVVQAVIFVVWHEDTGDYPALFLFGLAAAWLALRSGGLLAPMAFHAIVNLVALSVLIQVWN